MLKKLMKHEWIASGRIVAPMLGLLLLSAVGGNLSVRKLLEMDVFGLNMLGVILLMVFVCMLVGSCILCFAVMLSRFYKNLFGDEGYLMMTLPATVHEHIVSKLVVSVVWYALTMAAVVASMFILVYDVGMVREIGEAVCELFDEVMEAQIAGHAVLYAVELIALAVVACAALCLQFYAAMAMGYSASSHKALLSVVAYFLLQIVMQMVYALLAHVADVTGVITSVTMQMETMTVTTVPHVALIGATMFALVHGVVYYAITVYFMKNHLNLN